MPNPQPTERYWSWQAKDSPFQILVHPSVLEGIRTASMDGLRRIPRRGLEVGGVLFGRHRPGQLVIEAWRPIQCEHAYGPRFALSPNDHKKLEEQLRDYRADPELATLEPVGWFHSHTQEGLTFSEADRAIHQQFFPHPWQVALVVRPHMFEPVRAAFFFPDQKGQIQAEVVGEDFILEPPRRRAPIGFQPGEPTPSPPAPHRVQPEVPGPKRLFDLGSGPGLAPSVAGSGFQPDSDWLPREVGGREDRLSALPSLRESPPTRIWKWLQLSGVVVVGLLLAIWFFVPPEPGNPASSINLQVRDIGGQLLVEWNPSAAASRPTSKGELVIDDTGLQRRLELSPEEIRSGRLTYVPSGDQVEVRLTLRAPDGSVVTESTRFVGRVLPVGASPDESVGPVGGTKPAMNQELEQEAARLRDQLRKAVARTDALRQEVEQLRRQQARQRR